MSITAARTTTKRSTRMIVAIVSFHGKYKAVLCLYSEFPFFRLILNRLLLSMAQVLGLIWFELSPLRAGF
jgi:hypothetical protein